jgi:hypothetical protein
MSKTTVGLVLQSDVYCQIRGLSLPRVVAMMAAVYP